MFLAYIDLSPLVYLAGLPVAWLAGWGVARLLGRRSTRLGYLVTTWAIYSGLFLFFFAGPFVGRESQVSFDMRWTIAETPSMGQTQAEVILTFVDYPNHRVGEFSDRLAKYLQQQPDKVVPVTFAVVRDYGRMRGFRMVRIGDLSDWDSAFGYSASTGDGQRTPW
jgi:hypothetical protein